MKIKIGSLQTTQALFSLTYYVHLLEYVHVISKQCSPITPEAALSSLASMRTLFRSLPALCIRLLWSAFLKGSQILKREALRKLRKKEKPCIVVSQV